MLKSNRSSCSSMSFLSILWLLIVCAASGSRGRQQREAADEQSATRAQLAESHAICNQDGCYAVFFQKKVFREAGQACREQGGTLATMHTYEAAGVVHEMLSAIEGQGSRSRLRLWIGLHRPPRQCSSTRPLRGFVWVTGNQDGQFTNWIRDEMPKTCAVHRCVAMSVNMSDSGQESKANYRWAEGPCALHLDGYICQYSYKSMCSPLEDEGRGPAVYTTPFKHASTMLTHVPHGSVATLFCPVDTSNPDAPAEERVLCMEREDGTTGWSKDAPLCSSSAAALYRDWCSEDHGCEQHCQNKEDDYYCYCSEGFVIDEDGYSCKPDPLNQNDPPELSFKSAIPTEAPRIKRVCVEMGCEYDCFESARGFRCTCPPGYQIGPDGHRCSDVDECKQEPCPQLCVNTPGTFHCTCYQGYQPDNDGECVDVDECLDEGSCEGPCENTIGSFTCLCEPGYAFSGEGECLDVDECESESSCHHQCLNHVGGYSCKCDEGFDLQRDGITCLPSNYDEEYSTLTPDSGTSEELYLPWSTTDPYFEDDTNFDISWTEASEALTSDIAHPSDNRLNPWDDLSSRQYPTATPSTQKHSTDNNIENDVERGRDEQRDGALAKKVIESSSVIGESETPKVDSTKDANSTEMTKTGSAAGKRKQDKNWLLVALLVPLCVFLVVMLALGIVYCTSCAVDKSLSFSDCYRWVLPATPPARKYGKTQA
nr:endosialin [Nothobranchius furzeri]